MALPAEAASADLECALALALVSSALALLAMPGLGTAVQAPQRACGSMWFIAAAAGGLTALAASVGPSLGGFAAGLLSSLPLITGAVAMSEHRGSGHRAAAQFLRAYVGGLFGKAAFGAVFALLAPRMGAAAALSLGCACACLLCTVFNAPSAALGRAACR
ncbi:MAG: hypothetical protein EOP35_13805 [Rubrivivax sp.]|nr:MAG: hypothetical protein EOP35_13805 [Rubrivivax sp.]